MGPFLRSGQGWLSLCASERMSPVTMPPPDPLPARSSGSSVILPTAVSVLSSCKFHYVELMWEELEMFMFALIMFRGLVRGGGILRKTSWLLEGRNNLGLNFGLIKAQAWDGLAQMLARLSCVVFSSQSAWFMNITTIFILCPVPAILVTLPPKQDTSSSLPLLPAALGTLHSKCLFPVHFRGVVWSP